MTVADTRERTYAWTDPRETAAAAVGLDGLTFLRRLAAGEVPAAPIATTLGFTVHGVEEGRVVFGLEPAEFHYNPIGSVHGGVFATVIRQGRGVMASWRGRGVRTPGTVRPPGPVDPGRWPADPRSP